MDYDFLEGGEDKADVGHEGCLRDVFEVDGEFVGHHLFDVAAVGVFGGGKNLILVAVAYGGKRGDAGTHVKHTHLFRGVHVDILPHLRTRPHQTHVTLEYVDELRKLVEFILPDVVARTGNARVLAADCDESQFVAVRTHGAELEEAEIPVAPADAGLAVENRPLAVGLYPDGKHQK